MAKKFLLYVQDEEKFELYRKLLEKLGYSVAERINMLMDADLSTLILVGELAEKLEKKIESLPKGE